MNGLCAFDQMAIGMNPAQSADDIGLELEVHGEVGIFKIPKDPQANEFLTLGVDLFFCILPAGGPEGIGFDLDAGFPHLFLDHEFDGKTMTVPAGDIRGIEALETLALDDDVFQDLVDRMADVNLAIGVGRAIVQHEGGSILSGLPKLLVDAKFVPASKLLGFPLRQIAFHREIGRRKIQRGFVINGHGVARGADGPLKKWRAAWMSISIWALSSAMPSNRRSSRSRAWNSTSTRRP